jgi:hypothetical protein
MKWLRVVQCAGLLLSTSSLAVAQAGKSRHAAAQHSPSASFDLLKTLAGKWTGETHVAGPSPDSFPVQVSMRVTSGGDALMHEMTPDGRVEDPANGSDDPVTMFYLNGGRLMLTHYCDVGKNRPRMVARLLPDGKTIDFSFLDLSGETRRGHMHHATFTIVDTDHHVEDWTYEQPNGTRGRAHIVLTRAK